MKHSNIVGGSTADRVIACPASVALVQQMPPKEETEFMAKGTLCHNAMDAILSSDIPKRSVIGMRYADQVLTEDIYEDKIEGALALLNEVDPANVMEYVTEVEVSLDDMIPGVFGNSDLIGKIARRSIVLDWKMGDGVPVDAEENAQGLFYALAAMHTPAAQWAFQDTDEIEIVIVQPPHIRRWVTTHERVAAFGVELMEAVRMSKLDDAPMKAGKHCKWCNAKPICPLMTGAVDRALKVKIEGMPVEHINNYLKNADLLEDWIKDLRALAFQMSEKGVVLPDWKLVAKRSTRKWTNEPDAKAALLALGVTETEITETSLLSPAQAEKVLKKRKIALPADVVVSVSSGSTLAERSDPRPEVLQIGQQLTAALSKLV